MPAEEGVAMRQPETPSPDVPAGWYQDPDRTQSQRYWDGDKWTDQIAPIVQRVSGAAKATPAITWPKATAFVGAAAIIIGTIGPWGTSALESIAGTSTDGKWCLYVGVLALLLLVARRVVLLNILIGLAAGAEGAYRISKVNSYSVHALGQTIHPASVGWGLWIMVGGCVALIIGSWFYPDEIKARRIEEKVDRELDAEGVSG
jgi:Protein of unknown function (DUF2510)